MGADETQAKGFEDSHQDHTSHARAKRKAESSTDSFRGQNGREENHRRTEGNQMNYGQRIFGYIRYSSAGQDGNTTVATQREAIQCYIKVQGLKGQYVECRDEGKSGTTIEGREAMQQILGEARKGDMLTVYKYDRLGRNLFDSCRIVHELQQKGVKIFSTVEGDNEFMRNLMFSFAQEFSRQQSERCKRALDDTAKTGNVANKPAFGYHIEGTVAGQKKFVPTPEEAKIVRRIFDKRAAGVSLRDIVKALNADGLRTKSGRLWRVSTVRVILHNEAYIGRVISGARRFKKGYGLQEIRPRAEWVVANDAHEPLVTPKVWASVRKFDSSDRQSHARETSHCCQHLWTGFLKCMDCHCNLWRNSDGKISYYGCDGGRSTTGESLPCRSRYLLPANELTVRVARILRQNVYTNEWIADMISASREEVRRITESWDSVAQPLQAAIAKLDKQMESASRRVAQLPEVAQGFLIDEIRKLGLERAAKQEQLEAAQHLHGAPKVDFKGIEGRIRSEIGNLEELLANGDVEDGRALLAQYIEVIEVNKNKEALIHAKGIQGFNASIPSISPGGFGRTATYGGHVFQCSLAG